MHKMHRRFRHHRHYPSPISCFRTRTHTDRFRNSRAAFSTDHDDGDDDDSTARYTHVVYAC